MKCIIVILSDISDIFGVISIWYFKFIKSKLNNIVKIIRIYYCLSNGYLKYLVFLSNFNSPE